MAASPGLASGKFLLSQSTGRVKALLKASVLLARSSLPKGGCVGGRWLPWSGADGEGPRLSLEPPSGVMV